MKKTRFKFKSTEKKAIQRLYCMKYEGVLTQREGNEMEGVDDFLRLCICIAYVRLTLPSPDPEGLLLYRQNVHLTPPTPPPGIS